jgi:hypothetical protein
MKKIVMSFAVLLVIMVLSVSRADAWSATGRYGGHASGGGGSWSATSAAGGHASGGGGSWSATGAEGGHASGGGGSWSATGAYGGHASGGGGSWSATGAYGGHAYGSAGYGAVVYPHYGYHPPATVNYYGHACYNCGGWPVAGAVAAGAAVGMATGAAVASANTAAAASNAYSAGYVAGSTVAPVYLMNAIYPTLPSGCASPNVGGTTYFLCGNTWFLPSYGANGVFYRVVPTP